MKKQIQRVLQKVWMAVICIVFMGSVPEFTKAMQISGVSPVYNSQSMSLAQVQNRFYKAEIKAEISFDVKNVKLQEALAKLARQTGLKLTYRGDVMAEKQVSLQEESISVSDALDFLLADTGLDYKISQDGYLLIAGAEEMYEYEEELFQDTITGTVVDAETGEALPGVNVVIEGTTAGTTTNMDGEFQLEVPNLQETLVFTYIGYQRMEVPIDGREEIQVQLETDVQMLDDVVVVGYGTMQRSDITGSVSSISADDFTNPNSSSSVEQMIQGRVAGVQISQNTGEPGSGMSVNIRGAISLGAGSEPLYVVDGVPLDNSELLSGAGAAGTAPSNTPKNPLNSLNPNDIQSIEILKDASATAIYGARGAGGVILITTKSGHSGDVQIGYNVEYGWQNASQSERPEILSTREYIDVINGLSIGEGGNAVFSESDISRIGEGTDWLNQIFRVAPMASHNLSISGGSESTTYRASVNYFDQDGIIKDTGMQRYLGRLNLETQTESGTQFGMNLNASLLNDNNSAEGHEINETSGPYNAALQFDPTEPIYTEDGSFNRSPLLTIDNPVVRIEGVSSVTETDRIFGNAFIRQEISETLNARVNVGFDRTNQKRDIYNSSFTIQGESAGGLGSVSTLKRESFNLEFLMEYQNQLDENNSIQATGGVTYQKFQNDFFSGSISRFPTDDLKTKNFGLGDPQTANVSTNAGNNNILSYLGRVNYNLRDTYLLTVSFRADGSSRFGENSRFGYFPSLAIAKRFSNYEFVPEMFNELKLRAGWGRIGNQEIGNYNHIPTYSPGPTAIFNNQPITSLNPTRLPNPDLRWETTEQYNAGLDFGILGDRLHGSIDLFLKKTTDMLVNQPVQTSSGFSSILNNVGSMENKGFELMINSVNMSNMDFSWSTSFNFSVARNEITELEGVGDINVGVYHGTAPPIAIHRVGYPVGSYFGHDVIGIWQEGDDISGSAQPSAKPGDPIIRDDNNDGVIDQDDRVILGDPHPDFLFGLQNTINYKNFQLDFFIQGEIGADMFNIQLLESMNPSNFRKNRFAKPFLDRWTPENTDTKWPSFINPSSYSGDKINSLSVQDGSFVRLKNLRLSYDIPQNLIRSARISVTGNNLFTITNYMGNPEVNSFGQGSVKADFASYPLARSFLLGIDLGF